jgi:PPK2 family polyphosphate:nucleotide phosphotransferase
MKARDYARPYRVTSGKGFNLKDFDPDEVRWVKSKDRATELLKRGVAVLSDLQEKLYAQDRWALLLIFQAMDAAGKDSTIEHVMSGVNPQGCQVFSFKGPSAEELDHDFLWRTSRNLPERGRIGIFNRSYYEETLVVRVHQEYLVGQKIPASLVTKDIWKQRFEDINAFERYISRNGVKVRKFFLHVSKKEQTRRFLSRLDEPSKNWKFSLADVREREYWDDYMNAYEETIRHTATEHAPWYVVPADHKWFMRLVVAAAVIDALDEMDLAYPEVDREKAHELEAVRQALKTQDGKTNKGKGKRR